ncbi:unnamed protein product [Closterium sp. Yama58-4]|nr:unnamed protein product [Closterium sp. Yama58-4]
MACVVSSSPSVISIRGLDYTQICLRPCVSLDKNHVFSVRFVFPSWSSLYQLRFGPLDHSSRKSFVRIRTPDRRVAVRCNAKNSSVAADSPETEDANFRFEPTADDKANVGAEFETRGVGKVEVGADREVGEKQGVTSEVGGKRGGRRAGKAKARSEGSGSKSREGEASEEEREAVAVIAQALMEKYGPQIVKEEEAGEEGIGNGRNEGREEVEGEATAVVRATAAAAAAAAAAEEEDGMGTEVKEEEAEAEASEEGSPSDEGSPSMTSRPTRATSRSSLLSLYRFFSSHLGISSPSTVASILASNPQLLRSNPTNELMPRVRLLQSFGISDADIVNITVKGAAWLRISIQQIQNTLEFLLAKGVRRSRLGLVLRRGRNLLCSEARSTNLDILVERAGVPVDKLGVIIRPS